MSEITIALPDGPAAARLAGRDNENLKILHVELHVTAAIRDGCLVLNGADDNIAMAAKVIEALAPLWQHGDAMSQRKFRYALHMLQAEPTANLQQLFSETLITSVRGKPIKAQSLMQRRYLEAIRDHDITFGLGPAGTGKTFLAVAMGVIALRDKQVNRLILTRPIVEAGEALGFLPGDIMAKVDPYFRPLYDSLYELMDTEKVHKLLERTVIEIAPLAYMRGRTLQEAFIILDEAQNTTPQQMKMFLTRIGVGSKAVITGDLSQIDLPKGRPSGLREAERILAGVPGIAFTPFSRVDVVRHPLVQAIIDAYEIADAANDPSAKGAVTDPPPSPKEP
ncbi:MAG: PhoH family protein [Candidatus Sericytochromatia bacterium]|nr:PhoH family protein [Candidatus Sericytochromatia bacterium]